ncbi:MAG: protein translocase subunit SecD [Candidatus Falkowbacteria bacterium]
MADNILKKIAYPSPRGRIWRNFFLIVILIAAGGLIDGGRYYNRGADWLSDKTGETINLPQTKDVPFRLGLDLLGGTQLIYEANMSDVPEVDRTSALDGVRDVIERRVNVFGVSEPLVQTSVSGDKYRIIVELAGIKDIAEAIDMIGETPLLEFKEEAGGERQLTAEEESALNDFNRQAEEKAEEVLGKLTAGGDFEALAKEYSQDEATKDGGGDLGWITARDNPAIVEDVKDYKAGQVSPELVKTGTGYAIYKLEEKRKKTNPFKEEETEKEIKASHILVCHKESESCASGLSKEEAYARVKDIEKDLTPMNFAGVAKEYSDDSGTKDQGGDLGWFGRGDMVKPFEDTVLEQKIGTISWIVETEFGYHLIYKEAERPVEEYHVRRITIRTMTAADLAGGEPEWKNTELTGKHLERSRVQFNPNDNTPEVGLEFDGEGAELFADITGRNIGKPVAIYLDGYPISIPTVNDKITGGQAVISGRFSIKEAKLLAERLNAGALPVPIELLNQQTVGASLGQASLAASLKAGMIGLGLVALFMLIFYRLPGLLSVFALIFYGVLILAVFKIWPVTLSLAGLAGFILSICMAVDANVLIFSRLNEELRAGKPLSLAIGDAFNRAWPSIRDGNVSTILTCLILMWFSTSIIKGFAITLLIGVLVSMFSAIIVTKNLLQLAAGAWLEKRPGLIGAGLKIK